MNTRTSLTSLIVLLMLPIGAARAEDLLSNGLRLKYDGMNVYSVDSAGATKLLADGIHTLMNGTKIEILGGKRVALPPAVADPYSDAAQRAPAGLSPNLTPVDFDEMIVKRRDGVAFNDAMLDSFDRQFATVQEELKSAPADLYFTQVKLSILSPTRHAGWPYRSDLVHQPGSRTKIIEVLGERFERTRDPLIAFALICPSLFVRDEAGAKRYATAVASDKLLSAILKLRLEARWRPFILGALEQPVIDEAQAAFRGFLGNLASIDRIDLMKDYTIPPLVRAKTFRDTAWLANTTQLLAAANPTRYQKNARKAFGNRAVFYAGNIRLFGVSLQMTPEDGLHEVIITASDGSNTSFRVSYENYMALWKRFTETE